MKNNEKNVIICNSVYQIMVAVQLKLHFFPKKETHIIISNHINDSEKICQNAEKTGLFASVTNVKNKKLIVPKNSKFKHLRKIFNRTKETFLNIKIILTFLKSHKNISHLCISNISIFTILFFFILSKKGKTKLSIFEDGFSTYCNAFRASDRASVIHKILNKNGLIGSAQKLFLFNPELLEWKFDGEIVKIPKFGNNEMLKNLLNVIFSYSNEENYENKKVIFMEESFFADGYEVEDVELIETISKFVKKDEIFVKIHPRNPINRFEKLGYKTNKNLAIPWELIIMNQDISRCALVTISSSSALTPYLIFDKNVVSISLLGLLKNRPGNMAGELGIFMQKVYERYPENFLAPKSEEEFLMILKNLT